ERLVQLGYGSTMVGGPWEFELSTKTLQRKGPNGSGCPGGTGIAPAGAGAMTLVGSLCARKVSAVAKVNSLSCSRKRTISGFSLYRFSNSPKAPLTTHP